MSITVNGEERPIDPGTTVADLVEEVAGRTDGRGVAVAHNGEVVRRDDWDTEIEDGDRLEILNAVQGG